MSQQTDHLKELRRTLEVRFDETDLQTLCFEMDIDYDRLNGKNKYDKIRELILYCNRHNHIITLYTTIQNIRPDISLDLQVIGSNNKIESLKPYDATPVENQNSRNTSFIVVVSIIITVILLLSTKISIDAFIKSLDNTKPGGLWIYPQDNFTIENNHIHFAAHAYDLPKNHTGIEYVDFTISYSGTWNIACTTRKPSYDDIYECDQDISYIPIGPIRVSFDVHDQAGNYSNAPNGMRSGNIIR